MKPVFLSAGHSNADPGAVAFGRKEADVAVEFRNLVSFYLTQAKVKHELDGAATDNLPLAATVKRTRARTGIEVEFHCNAAANPIAGGVETLSAPADMPLGGRICVALANALGIRNRGAKPENAGHHARLAFVQAGGIIVELFFITSPADLAAYDTKKWLAAKAVADVLIKEASA